MYYGEVLGYEVELDEESSDFTWVSLEKVLELPLADFQKRRVKDVIKHLENGDKFFA